MKVTIKLNQRKINDIENAVKKSALETMEAVNKDLVDAMTMPFEDGDMQNNQTFVCDESDDKKIYVRLETSADQSRYLYYGLKMVDSETGEGAKFRKGAKLKVKTPKEKLKFQTGKNVNAGAYWLEPYIDGNKKDFIKDEFEKTLKGKI